MRKQDKETCAEFDELFASVDALSASEIDEELRARGIEPSSAVHTVNEAIRKAVDAVVPKQSPPREANRAKPRFRMWGEAEDRVFAGRSNPVASGKNKDRHKG